MKIAHKLYLLVGGSALAFLALQLVLVKFNEAELRLPQTMQALQNDLLVLTQRDHLFEQDSSRSELRAGELAGLRNKLQTAKSEIPATYQPLIETVEADLKSKEQMRAEYLRYRNDFHEAEDNLQQAGKGLYEQARLCTGDSAFKLLALSTRLNQAEAQDLLVDKDIAKFDARASLITNQMERWISEKTRSCSGGRRQAIHAEFVQLQGALASLQDAGAKMDAYRLSTDTLETRMTHDLGKLRDGLSEYTDQMHERLRGFSLLLPLLIMSIMMLVAVLLVRSILRPLNQLVEYTQALKRDEYTASTPSVGKDELGVLSSTLGEMSTHLLNTIQQQHAREEELRAANLKIEEANRRLRSSESRYRVVYENAPVAFIVSNPEYLIIDWNRAAQTIFGWSREEALGQHLFDLLVPGELLPEVKDTIDETLNRHVSTHRENWNLTKSGERILCEWNNAQYTDDHGKFFGVISLGMNITERRKLEENIRLEKEKYRDLFDNANDLLFTTDLNGIFTSANHEMLRVLGYTKNELIGQPISKILAKDSLEIARGKMAAKINGEATHTSYLAKDGHVVPVEVHSRLIYEGRKPTGIQGIARNISEQLKREVELLTANLKAEEATRAKSRFLAAAGHDLRQPLAAANMFIGTLKFTKPNSNQSEIIGRLEGAMSDFNGLLNALLNISKLESGAIEPEYKPVAVADIAQWLKQSFAPMAEERGLGLKLRFPLENLVVRSDFNLLKQVLANLVSNAIKYTPQGSILVSARRRGTAVQFQVWDTGIGIEADQFEHIFKGFYQINNPQSDTENGLGLGLAIVKRSLALLNVEITYRSQFGRGSVFGFSLPLENTGLAPQTVSASAHDEMEIATFARGKRFMVLENDRLVAQAISGLLKAMGGEVKLFSSAEDALRYADTEKADYYICDYMLDGTSNGLQFLNQLRQKLGTPINALLLSGDTSPVFIREIKDCGWPVLSKPVNVSKLIICLNEQTHTVGRF
ncbi:MAG: PAS domain S-box protein [Gallionellaceae bacterium]|jgi:PAS domain S-box-containing protein